MKKILLLFSILIGGFTYLSAQNCGQFPEGGQGSSANTPYTSCINGEEFDLLTLIEGEDTDGSWNIESGEAVLNFNGSSFDPSDFGIGDFIISYKFENVCKTDIYIKVTCCDTDGNPFGSGDMCDDGMDNTINDQYNDSCECVGEPINCPTVTQSAMGSTDYCSDDSGVDLNAIDAMISYDTPMEQVAVSIQYYLTPPMTNEAPTNEYVPGDIIADITNSCDPITTTVYAYVVCDLLGDGSIYLDAGSFDVVVYPDLTTLNINVMDDDGACGPYVDTYDCEGVSGYSISNDYDTNGANPDFTGETMSGDVIFTISNSAVPTGSACSEVTASAMYVCAPDCPSEPSISADALELCGHGTVTITGIFGMDPSPGTFDIVSSDGLTASSPGVFDLPLNTTCEDIQTYTFTATATCNETMEGILPDPENSDDMTITVSVYPQLILKTISGNCIDGAQLILKTADEANECFSDIGPEPIIPDCNSGTTNIDSLNYPYILHPETICAQNFSDIVVYAECAAVSCGDCPSTTDNNTSEDLCSGDSPMMLPMLNLNDDNGQDVLWFVGDPAGTPLIDIVWANNTCEPFDTILNAYILCDKNPESTLEYHNLNFTHTVTVYPAPFSFNPSEGSCGVAASYEVNAENGEVCANNEGEIPVQPNCDSGATDDKSLPYNDTFFEDTCAELVFVGTITATCDAVECKDCPSISDNMPTTVSVSSGTSGAPTATPALIDDNDNGNDIEWFEGDPDDGGTPLDSIDWTNKTCDPIEIILNAYVLCDDDENPTTEEIYHDLNFNHTVTVYPAPLVFESTVGGCGAAASYQVIAVDESICASDTGVIPVQPACDSTEPDNQSLPYNFTFFEGTDFAQPINGTGMVEAICEAVPCTGCPSTESNPISGSICSGESVIPNNPALINGNGNDIEWFEGDPDDGGTPLASIDWTNNTCNVIAKTLNAYIQCDDDDDESTPNVYVNLFYTYEVAIYPAEFTLIPTEGNCEQAATLVILSADGTTACDTQTGEIPTPPACSVDVTVDATITYDSTFFALSICPQAFTDIQVTAICTSQAPDCDDNCTETIDTYNEQTCECEYELPDCDDGDCNTNDTYNAADCQCDNVITFPDCNDDNECTSDDYDDITCECSHTPIIDCSEGNNISSRIWLDNNQNGVQEAFEAEGVSDVAVTLYQAADNSLVQNTTSDINGDYIFTNLVEGEYYIGIDLPANYSLSPANNAGNNSIDCDFIDGFTEVFEIGSTTSLVFDAGLFPTGCSDFVVDANVVCDAELGIYSVNVAAFDANTNNFTVTSTHDNGFNGTFEDSFIDGPFDVGTSYTYTITVDGQEECMLVLEDIVFNCVTVDIELVRFEGQILDEANLLVWETTNEVDNDYFLLEKSLDGINFEALNQIPSKAPNNEGATYEYIDTDNIKGTSYYRLLSISSNGEQQFEGNIVTLVRKQATTEITDIYPIPIEGQIFLNITTPYEQSIRLQIFDIQGRLLDFKDLNLTKGENQAEIKVNELSAGLYFLAYNNEEGLQIAKFIKK